MNQILWVPSKTKKYKWFLYLELAVSLTIIISSLLYLPYHLYQEQKNNRILNSLLQPYSISKLYSPLKIVYDENYIPDSPYIIGTLEIPSISLNLPILSEMNDDLLKLSICRFYGPMPNEVGNLCIAGHNYDNGSFFSNLPQISVGDIIHLTDFSYQTITYQVTEKYEISAKDTSCTNQETNGKKCITLVTCNNFTGNRIIVKGTSTSNL